MHVIRTRIVLVQSATNCQNLTAIFNASAQSLRHYRSFYNKLFRALAKEIFSKLTYSLCVC